MTVCDPVLVGLLDEVGNTLPVEEALVDAVVLGLLLDVVACEDDGGSVDEPEGVDSCESEEVGDGDDVSCCEGVAVGVSPLVTVWLGVSEELDAWDALAVWDALVA